MIVKELIEILEKYDERLHVNIIMKGEIARYNAFEIPGLFQSDVI